MKIIDKLLLCSFFFLGCDMELVDDGEAPFHEDNTKQENIEPYQLQVWLDFDGGVLNKVASCKTASPDETCIKHTDGMYEAVDFDLDTQISIGFELERIFYDFDIDVSRTRPEHEPFVHVVFSPMKLHTEHEERSTLGFAYVDCGNKNKNGVVFVKNADASSPAKIANTTAHEIGHSLGFDHQSAVVGHVMFVRAESNVPFLDACIRTDDNAKCSDRHRAWRCNPGHRNYYRELMALIGPQEVWLSE